MFIFCLLLNILLCVELFQETLSQPKHNLRIAGGTESRITDIPYFAQVVNRKNGEFCGGAIVTEKCVITVNSCVVDPIKDYRILVGSIVKGSGDPYNIQQKHTCETSSAIMLYTTISIMFKSQRITSVKIPKSEQVWSMDIYGTTSGFGASSSGGSNRNKLYYAKVKIFKNDFCGTKLQTSLSKDFICAGFLEGDVDACTGDLGGPLVSEENELIGLALGPFGCGMKGKLTVYADIVSASSCLQEVYNYRLASDIDSTPYLAQVLHNQTSDICVGAIIHEKMVLTLSQCIAEPNVQYFVLVGSDTPYKGHKYFAKSVITKSRDTFNNDLCLLVINGLFTPQNGVSVIPLIAEDDQNNFGKNATITGFGTISQNQSKLLSRNALLKILPYDKCEVNHKFTKSLSSGYICGNYYEDKSTACIGDRGSPIVINNYLIGIATDYYKCDAENRNVLFVNVLPFKNWITKQIVGVNLKRNDSIGICRCTMDNWIMSNWNIDVKLCEGTCNSNRNFLTDLTTQKYCNTIPISDTCFITVSSCIKPVILKSFNLTPSNYTLEFNGIEYDVNTLVYGVNLLPFFTNSNFDIVIVKISKPLDLPFNFNLFTLNPFFDSIFPENGILVKHLTDETSNLTSISIPVSIVPPRRCSALIKNPMPFKVVGEMFCIKPKCEKVNEPCNICSDRGGAPIFDVEGYLVGLVIWQGYCARNGPTVALRISKFTQVFNDEISNNENHLFK